MEHKLDQQNDISLAPAKMSPTIRHSGKFFHRSALSHKIKKFKEYKIKIKKRADLNKLTEHVLKTGVKLRARLY